MLKHLKQERFIFSWDKFLPEDFVYTIHCIDPLRKWEILVNWCCVITNNITIMFQKSTLKIRRIKGVFLMLTIQNLIKKAQNSQRCNKNNHTDFCSNNLISIFHDSQIATIFCITEYLCHQARSHKARQR